MAKHTYSPQLADRIELWSPKDLASYERNPRTHSDEQVDQIAASITEFGFTNPILAQSDGDIIAGHGRLSAAQRLGLEQVPVIILDHLSDAQRRALVIADNKLALNASWDDDLLSYELKALENDDFDLSLTGFSDDELEDLLPDFDEDGGEEDENADESATDKTVSREGDVWLLNEQRLTCTHAEECDVIISSWQIRTSKQAKHLDTGKTFEELSQERLNA